MSIADCGGGFLVPWRRLVQAVPLAPSMSEQFFNASLAQWYSVHPRLGPSVLAGVIWSIIGAAMAFYVMH